MSQQIPTLMRTFTAGEAMTAKQHYIVQMDSSGDAEVGEGATDFLIGVLQNKPVSGGPALVAFGGTAKVKLGSGGCSIGDWITSDSAGKGVTTTTDGNITIGRALEAGDEDDIVEVMLSIQHLYIA